MKGQRKTMIPVYSGREEQLPDTSGDFNVACFEQANIWQLQPHRRTFYQVIFFREGHGKQYIDFREYTFKAPTLILLSPNQVHQMDIGTDARGHILMLPERFFALDSSPESTFPLKDVFDNIEQWPILSCHDDVALLLDDTIRQIQRSLSADGSMQRLITLSYVKIFLLRVFQLREALYETDRLRFDTGRGPFRQFKSLLEEHYREWHLPQQYAAQMHISMKQLNMLARKFAGSSAGNMIKQRILLEAQRHLYHGTLTVKEISYHLGFEDPAYFNRFFRKEMKIPPRQFRQLVKFSAR